MSESVHEQRSVVKLVSTGWLHEHLVDKDLTIVDVQPDIHDYIQEHIPGAIYLSEGVLRSSFDGIPGKYVPPETIEPLLRAIGLREHVPALVYTAKGAFKEWGDGLEQAMMAYSLARYGHERIYVLDGGMDKWKAECRTLTGDFPGVVPSDFTVRVKKEYFIEYEEFKAIKSDPNVLVLDARPPGMYEGQGPWSKPGHIPGALNLPWMSLMDDDNRCLLRSSSELFAILDRLKIGPGKTIICTCGTGREATAEFLLFKWYLGYPDVRLYEGSFTEWSAYPGNPTVTGKEPYASEVTAGR